MHVHFQVYYSSGTFVGVTQSEPNAQQIGSTKPCMGISCVYADYLQMLIEH